MAQEDLEIKIKTSIDAVNSAKTLGELKSSIKDLKGLALQTEKGSAAFNTLTAAIGSANDKLGDLNDAIKAQSGSGLQNLVGAFGKMGSVAVNSFQVAQGAMSAFGDSTGVAMEEMRKLQGFMALTSGLQNLADIGDTLSNIGATLKSSILPLYTSVNTAMMTLGTTLGNINLQSFTSGISNFFSKMGSGFTGLISGFKNFGVAVKAFVSTNPFGVILIAITTIIGLLAALVEDFKPVQFLFEGVKKVIGAVIQALKDFTDWLGITSFKEKEAAEQNLKLIEKERRATKDKYDQRIALDEIYGKKTRALRVSSLKEETEYNQKEIRVYEEKSFKKIKLTEEENKRLQELRQKNEENKALIEQEAAKASMDLYTLRENSEKSITAAMEEGSKKTKKVSQEAIADAERARNKALQAAEDSFEAMEKWKLPEQMLKSTKDLIEKQYAAEVKKINRDVAKSSLENYKKYLAERKSQIDEETSLLVKSRALWLEKLKESNENQLKTAEIYLQRDLKLAQENGTSKEAVRQEFYDKVEQLANKEIEAEKAVYDARLKGINDALKLYKVGSNDYKRLVLEKEELELNFHKKTETIYNEYAAKETSILTNMLEKYLDTYEQTTDKVYQYELAKINETESNQVRFINQTIHDEKAKEAALENIKSESLSKKLKLDKKYNDELENMSKTLLETEKLTSNNLFGQAEQTREAAINSANKEHREKVKLLNEYVALLKAQGKTKEQIEEKTAGEIEAINVDLFNKLKNAKDEYLQDSLSALAQYVSEFGSEINSIIGNFNDLIQQGIQQQTDAFKLAYNQDRQNLDYSYQQKEQDISDSLAIQLANFQGSEEERAAIEKKANQDRVRRENEYKLAKYKAELESFNFEEMMRRKSFEAAKKAALAQAYISAATAILNALASGKPPLNFIQAALAAITAGIEITKISSQQYQSGGVPPAPPVLANPAAAGLRGGGGGGAPGGGGPTAPAFFNLGQGGPNTTIPMTAGGEPQRVYVLEGDITGVQNKVAVIESRATTKI